MKALPANPSGKRPLPDWIPQAVFLSGALSLVTHCLLVLAFAVTVRGCHREPVGFTHEDFREVGIVVTQVGDHPDAVVPGEPHEGEITESPARQDEPRDAFAPTRAVPENPPVETSLPKLDTVARIGPGVNLPVDTVVTDPRQPVKSSGNQRPTATGSMGGAPGTAFMGTTDQGSKVVFVIDASGSMTAHNSMQVAKSALVSSIQALDDRQKFMIVFYDDEPTVLNLKTGSKPQLNSATDINKTLARQKIAGIQPGSGTRHFSALDVALSLAPDVIFFLTDAQDPVLEPQELDRIKRMNGKRTRIHSIEFGVGPEVSEKVMPNNFLRVLSRQNGGTYRYHDVTRFK